MGSGIFASARTTEEVVADLGSDSPAVRELAVDELYQSGPEVEALLMGLEASDDVWIAGRATRLLREMRGMEGDFSPELELKLSGFDDLPADGQCKVLAEVVKAGGLNSLLRLHRRLLWKGDVDRDLSNAIRAGITSLCGGKVETIKNLRPQRLPLPTQGMLISAFSSMGAEGGFELYEEWLELNPDLRKHLDGRGVDYESQRLGEQGTSEEWLALLGSLLDVEARRKVVERLKRKQFDFPMDGLGEDACIGCLELFRQKSKPEELSAWYAKQCDRLPGLPAKLPDYLKQFEILRLRDAGRFEEALTMALLIPESVDQRAFGEARPGRLGGWLREHAEALPGGLPRIEEASAMPAMIEFLKGLLMMPRPLPADELRDRIVERFDHWAVDAGWLDAARCGGSLPVYHWVLSRRGGLDRALARHEKNVDGEGLEMLGALIRYHPELGRAVSPGRCLRWTLRSILRGGVLVNCRDETEAFEFALMADRWTETYPDLLAGDVALKPLLAFAKWTGGDRPGAVAELIAADKLQLRLNPKDTGDAISKFSTALLGELLYSAADLDVESVFQNVQLDQVLLQDLIRRGLSGRSMIASSVRTGLDLAALFRERFKSDPLGDGEIRFSCHDAQDLALRFWREGYDELASRLMFEGFCSSPDPEERFGPWYAEYAAMFGYAEEALLELEQREGEVRSKNLGFKRAQLLRAMGRGKEALECRFPDQSPASHLEIQLVNHDWSGAMRSSIDVYPERDEREVVRSYIAYLSGDPVIRRTNLLKGHRTLDQLEGTALGLSRMSLGDLERSPSFYARRFRSIAQDALLASMYESRLIYAMASALPIEIEVMVSYLDQVDLLPDPERSAGLALAMGRQQASMSVNAPLSGRKEGPVVGMAHKLVAAKALLELGHGEQAFGVIEPLLEAWDAETIRHWPSTYQCFSIVKAVDQLARLAELEWGQLAVKDRLEVLGAIMSRPKAGDRARGLIGLLEKHHGEFDQKESRSLLMIPEWDLRGAGGVPEDLLVRLEELLLVLEFDEPMKERMLGRWSQLGGSTSPPRFFSFRNGRATVKFGREPGVHFDPKSDEFVVFDGLGEVDRLWNDGEMDEARELLSAVFTRVMLDSSLIGKKEELTLSFGSRANSRMDGITFVIALACFDAWEMDAELVAPFVGACWRPGINWSADERLWWASCVYENAGELEKALDVYQLYLLRTMSVSGRNPAMNPSGLIRLEALLAIEKGEMEKALDALRRFNLIAPYDFDVARGIVEAIKERGDAEAVEGARRVLETYWKAKMLEMPSCRTYANSWARWELLFDEL